jgi:hypothetical protein
MFRDFRASQVFVDNDLALRIHTVHLKTALRAIESDAFYPHGPVPFLMCDILFFFRLSHSLPQGESIPSR